jgi:hypothetical protein
VGFGSGDFPLFEGGRGRNIYIILSSQLIISATLSIFITSFDKKMCVVTQTFLLKIQKGICQKNQAMDEVQNIN